MRSDGWQWTRLDAGDAAEFSPGLIRAQQRPPAPLPRAVLYALMALFGSLLLWAYLGRLDIVAVAPGRLVPQSHIKIVQPAESGIVREILVREGDTVREGQVLVRMDARLSEADGKSLQAELHRRRLQLRRIDAELTGAGLAREAEDPADIHAQTEAQLLARRQAHLDTLAAERAILQRARHDLQGALEIREKLRQSVPVYREQAESWDKLAREGYAGRLLALERQRVYQESEQDLKAQSQNVEGLKAQIAQSERRIAQITSNYRQQLQQERAEAAAALHRLEQERDKQRHREALLELVAPQAGIVKELATHTPGTVVAPGTILLTVVPSGEPLVAEVWVDNSDAGFVREQQKARVKVAAYPFQKFGLVDGAVRRISADAQEDATTKSGQGRSRQESAYRALIDLGSRPTTSHGRQLDLIAGMQVSAEIHLGTRSVLEYLLSPVQRVAHEAGRER